LLPAGAVAGWGLHPLESAALSRRTRRAVIPDCQDGPKCGGLPTKIALPRFSAEFPVGLRCGQFAGNHANGPSGGKIGGGYPEH
jgi:hypothetical protein